MSFELIANSIEDKEAATDKVCGAFEEEIKKRYGEDGENPLAFHNEKHSEKLAENSVGFLKTIQKIDSDLVSEKDLETAEIIAWGHDLVQDSTFNEDTGIITRHRGFSPDDIPANLREKGITKGNEGESAKEIIDSMKNAGVDVSPEKEKEIEEGVAATYPDVSFNPENGLKIYQPYLKPESSVLTLAIAEGDLRGDLWSEKFDTFKDSGNAEFRELNKGISMEVKKIMRGEAQMIPERKGMVANSILDWVKGQIDFANSQKELFWEAIENNASINGSAKSAEIKDALKKKYFDNIEKNAEIAKERYDNLIVGFKEKYDLGDDPKQWPEKLKSINEQDFNSLLEEIGY